MKVCARCGLCFEDTATHCSVCGSPLAMTPPAPSKQPPSLVKSIVGVVLAASGLECAIGAAVIQFYMSLCTLLFYWADAVSSNDDKGLMLINGFFNGYMLFLVILLGGAALACGLVGRRLATQCEANGNRSRTVSIAKAIGRAAVIVTVLALSLSLIHVVLNLVGLSL